MVLLDTFDDVPHGPVTFTDAPLLLLLGCTCLLTPSTKRDQGAIPTAHEDGHHVLHCDADAVLVALGTGQRTESADVAVGLPDFGR